jgi:lipopolysaccharide/colanic/teichoic acid biosynthesis glycosyltransferase
MEDGGPVFYSATRVGRRGQEFNFYKFRSMVVDASKQKDELLDKNESGAGVIFKMKKDPRITRVGAFIRKYSIDELPQLFNVLRGDMSLVGPRPPLPKEVEKYKVGDRYRLEVIPGLTCIWQTSGRSQLDFNTQVKLDTDYIMEQSFFYDLKLILKTVPTVLGGQGAY